MLTDFRQRDKLNRIRVIEAWVDKAEWFNVRELKEGAGFGCIERARTWARDAFDRGDLERRGKWQSGYQYRAKPLRVER